MAYGKIKADTLVYDNSGSDTEVTISSLGNKASLPASAGTVGASEVVQVDANKDTTGIRNLTISGNLQVNGTTTTVASSTMTVTDKNIELATGAANDAAADGGGITLVSGDGNKTWNWVDATDAWTSSEHIHLGDNKKLLVGSDGAGDLSIYHNGTNSIISNTTGALKLLLNNDEDAVVANQNGAVELYHDGTKKIETTATGVTVTGSVTDTKGDLRTIPQNSQSSAYTLSGSDAGKHIYYSGSAAAITVPSGQFNVGDAVTIISANSSANITIEQSGTTIHNAADATTGTRTLAPKGMATLICVASNVFSISGAGLS
tara:strand:- start:73 stop:1026 length:954 start_codon:yes stop_codon:yes gene_type:complete